MKLIIHDGNEAFEKELKQALGDKEELCFISEKQPIHNCVGCFGCWVKTPTECLIRDGYHTTPKKCRDASEVIIISECVYGMYSPFVKNVLDRTIGYIHPYFVKRGGEMHHKLRYDKVLPIKYFFYGQNTREERTLTERIVTANTLNLNSRIVALSFAENQEDVLAQLKGQEVRSVTDVSISVPVPAGKNVELETSKIALISASPKAGQSASRALLDMLADHLKTKEIVNVSLHKNTVSEQDLEQMMDCDQVVFSFPLYVDCLPSHFLRCLMQIEHHMVNQKKKFHGVYAIANNGFYDAHQNIPAIEVIRNWCSRVDAPFAGGVAVGGGGMVVGVYASAGANGPLKSIDNKMKELAAQICGTQDKQGKIEQVTPNFPGFLYKMAAQMGWRDSARKNGLKIRELDKK